MGGAWPSPAGLSNVVATASGASTALALKADGTVVWWKGCLVAGLGLTTTNLPVPADVSDVIAIAMGSDYAFDLMPWALKADGTVAGWSTDGNNCSHQCARRGLDHVVAIAGGVHHCLALKPDGTVVAWGDQIATPAQTNVPSGLSNVIRDCRRWCSQPGLGRDQ